jgi:hypothetical protein
MPKVSQKYSPAKMEELKSYLERESEKGRKKDFEICIDDEKVVMRTDDTGQFDGYQGEMGEGTQEVVVLVYDGASNYNTRYVYHVEGSGAPKLPGSTLGSLGDIEQFINQKWEQKQNEYELERVRKELCAIEDELEEANDYIGKLEKSVAELEGQVSSKKFNWGNINVMEAGAELLKHTIAAKAGANKWAGAAAGILGALGALPLSADTAGQPPAANGDSQPAGGATEYVEQPQLTERQKLLLGTVEALEAQLRPAELHVVNLILMQLVSTPVHIPAVAQLLKINT